MGVSVVTPGGLYNPSPSIFLLFSCASPSSSFPSFLSVANAGGAIKLSMGASLTSDGSYDAISDFGTLLYCVRVSVKIIERVADGCVGQEEL